MMEALNIADRGYSAVFIFRLGEGAESIRFVRDEDGRRDEREDSAPSLGRWYHHWRATSIAPVNRTIWSVHLDEFTTKFKFVAPKASQYKGTTS